MLRRAVIIGFTANATIHKFVAAVVTPMNPRTSLQLRTAVTQRSSFNQSAIARISVGTISTVPCDFTSASESSNTI